MGKYEFDYKNDEENSYKCYILTSIANELAEANRLKRLELDDEYSWDLEDQA